ncbi:MAG: hypothetical protein NXI15_02420 [Gammaproteobacteria bacterium]|nr:hypothetical protein [Gammaproteobacteria bacterium]
MADLHIEDFYRDVAKTLLHLYGTFPTKTILYVEDISGPDEPDEFGLHNPRFNACFSAMVWLSEQGYLTFDDVIGREALDQAVLTRHSFLLLTAMAYCAGDDEGNAARDDTPDSAAASELPASIAATLQSNVMQLRNAVRSASSIRIKNCVRALLAHPPVTATSSA